MNRLLSIYLIRKLQKKHCINNNNINNNIIIVIAYRKYERAGSVSDVLCDAAQDKLID